MPATPRRPAPDYTTSGTPIKPSLYRAMISMAMDRLYRAVMADTLPDKDTSRILGLYSTKINVETSRFGCIQVAVRHYRVSQSQMVEIWLKGGTVLQDTLLSLPGVRDSYFGQYVTRRGGIPGKVASVFPSDPDFMEDLPDIPGAINGRRLSLEEELTLMIRHEQQQLRQQQQAAKEEAVADTTTTTNASGIPPSSSLLPSSAMMA